MSKVNGKVPQRAKVTELLLDSGVRAFVRPLTQYTRQVLFQHLREEFPYPDEKEWGEQIEDMESPGAVIPITNESNTRHKEWKDLISKADNLRNRGYFEALVELCVTWPDYPDQDSLIEDFEERIRDLSAFADLSDDSWLNTLYHALCASQGDIDEIIEAAHEQIDIMEAEPTEAEIHTAWRVFRPRISRSERSRFSEQSSLLQKFAQLRDKV